MRKRKNIKKLKLLLALILSFLFVWFVFDKFDILKVKTFEIRTDYDFKKNGALGKTLESYLGKFIFLIDQEKLSRQIKDQQLEIGKVLASKKFPSKIILQIQSRQPLVTLFYKGKFFWVDGEGFIFKDSAGAPDLPVFEKSLQNLKVGSTIELGGVENLINTLLPEKIKKIQVGQILQIETVTGTEIFLPKEITAEKLTALQTILNRFRIEGKRLTKIDLRFEKPVIAF